MLRIPDCLLALCIDPTVPIQIVDFAFSRRHRRWRCVDFNAFTVPALPILGFVHEGANKINLLRFVNFHFA
jgi:hypothetical protein